MFEISARTMKKSLHFAVAKIKILRLFEAIIDVYSENHKKHINTK
jgi:hypothetical protein